ncbi:MAG: hypothetical protein AB7Q29_19815 [Vicinamibacterales bacterium]
MNIKTNIRAGKGGASGAGKNGKSSGADNAPEVEIEVETPEIVYVPPVSRCTGL